MLQALFVKENHLLAKYEDILSKEEIFQKQKSREGWLRAGDKSTKYFHNVMRVRRNKNKITRLEVQGNYTIKDPQAIRNEIVQFFSKLLNNEDGFDLREKMKFFSMIPKVISDDQNMKLNEIFSMEEVSISLNQLPFDKAP